MADRFIEQSKEIANNFIQNIVFIDDKAYKNDMTNNAFSALDVSNVFAQSGKICAVYAPKSISDVNSYNTILNKADVVILDWYLDIEKEENQVEDPDADADNDDPRGEFTLKLISQGITRACTEVVAQAIQATHGEVLTYDDEICDARFSKCCGGVVEEFSSCWENINPPYLTALRDDKNEKDFPDLKNEDTARQWIYTSPTAFCNTTDKKILSQVLNNYDQETTDFYRWSVVYSQSELAHLIHEKSGIDFGEIIDLKPIERGTSGRLVRLQIQGSKQTLIIGKELEIRRVLSPSHLYSSAFVVEREDIQNGIPQRFVIHGAGWGHGVGLCQIGAAVMGEQGYPYREILLHYFVGANIEKLY
mgnify:CR=1 FL=1